LRQACRLECVQLVHIAIMRGRSGTEGCFSGLLRLRRRPDVLRVRSLSGSLTEDRNVRRQSFSDLFQALSDFRRRGVEVVSKRSGEDGQVQLKAACDLLEALLGGVATQLGSSAADCEISEVDGPWKSNEEVVRITVRFPQAFVGEVATLSKFYYDVKLQQEMHFALRLPPYEVKKEPLIITVSGLVFMALPEMAGLRQRIKDGLGGRLDQESALAWWQQHKDQEYPLKSSKFHRIYESCRFLMRQHRVDFFWSFLLGTDCAIQSLQFHADGKGSVRLSAEKAAPTSVEVAELEAMSAAHGRRMLAHNRQSAEKYAASSINFGAMLYGLDVKQAPANAEKVTKLLTAAKWWGPGEDGWKRYDKTWQCTDRKNAFGKTVAEQGRIIWRRQSNDGIVQEEELAPVAVLPGRSPTSWLGRLCCRRRAPVLLAAGEVQRSENGVVGLRPAAALLAEGF